MIFRMILTSLVLLALFTVLTGALYPLAVTSIAQLAFPYEANGSIITREGKKVGSELIGQPFDDHKYFWGRLSATGLVAYNAAASSGSNLGPMNPTLASSALQRATDLRSADPSNGSPIPIDLVTASGSGLDPHISVAAALYQLPRVARVRGMSVRKVRDIIERNTEGRFLGFLGETRVNVLSLNLALDAADGGK